MAEGGPGDEDKQAEWRGDYNPLSDPEERRVLSSALDSFRSYRRAAHYNVTHLRRQSFYALPAAHWGLLAEPPFSMLETFSAVDDAIDVNADLAEAIYETGIKSFGLLDLPHNLESGIEVRLSSEEQLRSDEPSSQQPESSQERPWHQSAVTPADLDKAQSTLRQLYRDWAAEGATERAACYGPVLRALEEEFGSLPDARRETVRVLVPGAGLGRLMFEICVAGFAVEGNEISYHQLLTSSFIFNHTDQAQQYPLFPWALGFANHVTREDQLQKVMIPDVHPGMILHSASEGRTVHASERLSMSAADFCVLYNELEYRDLYDAVATVFFIDTAPNLISYIETIKNCLKTGGVWVNLGPLLWHFESNQTRDKDRKKGNTNRAHSGEVDNLGIGEPGSVELTNDEVIRLVHHFGFAIERHDFGNLAMGYIQDPKSMLMTAYRPSFWIARKLAS